MGRKRWPTSGRTGTARVWHETDPAGDAWQQQCGNGLRNAEMDFAAEGLRCRIAIELPRAG
jgi:hypothetical protein